MWTKLATETLLRHPRLLVEEDEVELPSGTQTRYLRYSENGHGAVILAINDNEEILFLREYSYVPNKFLLQLPMGAIHEDESPEAGAGRELREEGGVQAETFRLVGSYLQHHRRSLDAGYVFVATELSPAPLVGDEEEVIERVWIPLRKLPAMIAAGEISDADTLAALCLAQL